MPPISSAILVTRPRHDDITYYFHQWTESILDFLTQKGIRYFDLDDQKANRKTFESYNQANKPGLLFFNGHGSTDCICGHNDEALIRMGDNERTTEGKIVYARSCFTGVGLGDSCVLNGDAKAFIGYVNGFAIMYDPNMAHDPKSDRIAEPFFRCSNIIVMTLLKGKTVSQAVLRSYDEFKKTYDTISTSGDQDLIHTLPYLRSNAIGLRAIGDPDARIT